MSRFHTPVRIHGYDFSNYSTLNDYIRINYPKEYAQYWNQHFPSEYSIFAGTTISAEQFDFIKRSLEKTKCNELGGKILLLLGILHEPVSSSGSTGSNEVNLQEMFHDLERAFSSLYIDPHHFAEEIVETLINYMDCYCSEKDTYVAPCTSLITSSMMGKSRLLKQIANHTPLIYICLRPSRSTGYPKRSPRIVQWILQDLRLCLKSKSMSRDDSNFLATLKFSVFFEVTLDKLAELISSRSLVVTGSGFSWLWDFFAEPKENQKLDSFWGSVIEGAEKLLYEKCFDEKKNSYLPGRAYDYLKGAHPGSTSLKLQSFWESVAPFGLNKRTLPFLFVFDEARSLCETDSYGFPVPEYYSKYQKTEIPAIPQGERNPSPVQFLAFKAGRRALRYLRKNTGSEVPRIFGVFTDTTSRITNFQPTSWDESSGRFPDLPDPGKQQFPPIYLFASIDVYSRLHNISMLSRPEDATIIHRLLKFGRAGWYSIYQQVEARLQREASKSSVKEIDARDSISRLIGMAKAKLTNSTRQLVKLPSEPKEFLQHLAVLSPRLALTIGPYNVEAAELVASHLAVLGGTDDERHFWRTYYPSEPFLAAVSALCTKSRGWHGPLKALNHYVMGGVVEAGFRGELLTKLTCLMAMDYLLSSKDMDPLPLNQLRFSRVVRVSQFLNALITPRTGNTFCEMLHGVKPNEPFPSGTLNVDESKLQTFLNGYIFFNHFVRVEVKVSIPMLVHAWNRGAAIMCQTGAKGIDYVIPVILPAQEGDENSFEPLHDEWTNVQCHTASRRVSYILINSRNYATPKKRFVAAWAAKFSGKNFESCQKANIIKRPETVEQLLTQVDEEDDEDEESDGENDFGPDCPVENFNELDKSWNPKEFETKQAERLEKMQLDKPEKVVEETDNVFMSLVQDFGNRSKKEYPISVGEILPERRFTRPSPYRQLVEIKPITQFIVILKGIGPETYRFLRDDVVDFEHPGITPEDLELTRRYLKELRRTRYDYVENRRQLMAKFKDHKPIGKSLEAIVEGLPLVFNSESYTSEPWKKSRIQLQQSERDILRRFEIEGD